MYSRLQKIFHPLPVLFGLAATPALACGLHQQMANSETANSAPVYVRNAIVGKDEAGNPKTMCAFIVDPDDPDKMVTGVIRGEGARFKFPDGSLVILFPNGSMQLFSPSQKFSQLVPQQDQAATQTVNRIVEMCAAVGV